MVWQWISRLMGGAMDEGFDNMMFKTARDKYTDNMLMMMSIMKKMGPINGMELLMRACQGETLERPLGSHLHLSPWESILLNPVHLFRFPVEDTQPIDTTVVIGPRAKKPLQLDIPIFITGMSYGTALSKEAKIALARAASVMGTATNTGEAGLLKDEREAATKLIGQYNRGGYLNNPDKYKQVNAIEIQLGQGAQGAAPQTTKAKFVDNEMRQVFELREGEDSVLHSRVPGINSIEDFKSTVKRLKSETEVPVGVKMAASHFLEQELAIAVDAGVDFVTVDGSEGGTHGASPTLEDDLGLPSIYAIARARRFLQDHDLRGRLSLLAGGGLITPGQFLKALALGADAVYIGTAAVMALVAQQMTKVEPAEPPTQLILHTGKSKRLFDIDLGTTSLTNFLRLVVEEMTATMYAMGKRSVNQLDESDLCCLDPWLARALGVPYAGVGPQDQTAFYQHPELTRWQPEEMPTQVH